MTIVYKLIDDREMTAELANDPNQDLSDLRIELEIRDITKADAMNTEALTKTFDLIKERLIDYYTN